MIERDGDKLIFLISQPRAGSTLLQRMLAGHPQIHTTGEPWLMLPLVMAMRPGAHKAAYQPAWAQDAMTEFLHTLPDDRATYNQATAAMATHLYNASLNTTDKTHFLDKTPRYYAIIPELAQIFPKARFILLLRNPLAVLTSIIETWIQESWMSLFLYKEDLLDAPRALLEGKQLLGERAIIVQYENLVNQSEALLRDVSLHCGVEPISGLSNYGENNLPEWKLGDATNVYAYDRPTANLAEKWRTRLGDPQVWRLIHDYLEVLGDEVIAGMGYNPTELHMALDKHRPPVYQRGLSVSLDWLLNTTKYDRSRWAFHGMRVLRGLQQTTT